MSDAPYSSSTGPVPGHPLIPRAHLPRDPVTVVNPERRGLVTVDEGSAAPDSGLVRTLFPATDAPAPIGDESNLQLGHFRIVERIRTGGMGAVFRAIDLRLNRPVAIKILPPAQSRDMGSVQRFRNEAQAAAQLDHENIARVYYIGEDQGLHFIAFEFVQGTNIRDLIQQQGRLPVEDAVNYALQVASALAHTSAHGVVHRDIKPSNIIITRNGRAKLVDLGLARNENSEQVDLTAPGTTLGTFDYISPEQAYDPRSADVRSDVYSLGCTLYHMLTGEPPYPEGTVMQKLLQHKGDEAPDPAARNRKVPENLAAVTRKMMAKEARRRYQTAEELIQDLMLVAGSLGLRSISPEGLVWLSSAGKTPFWERHLAWMATLAALLLIVGYLEFGRPAFAPPVASNVHDASTSPADRKPGDKAGNAHPEITAGKSPPTDKPGKVADARPAPTKVPDKDPQPQAAKTNVKTSAPPAADVASLDVDPSGPVSFRPGIDAGLPRLGPVRPKDLSGLGPADVSPASAEVATASPRNAPPRIDSPQEVSPAVKPSERPGDAPMAETGDAVWMISRGVGLPYGSVAAACAQAEDGAVIELGYNGFRKETPLRITRKISIVAKRGFRPGLEFLPREEPASGSQARMITVANGSLELVGVDLQVTVDPNVPADFWSVLSLLRPEAVRLKGVTITLRNPRQSPAAIIELPAGSTTTMPEMGMEKMARPALEIEIAGCFIRGSGDLVIARNVDPARIAVSDSIVALQGSLIQARGDQAGKSGEDRLDLRLDHVTASLTAGLLRLEGGPSPRRFLPVQVTAANSIFTTSAGAPLVGMTGVAPTADFRRLLAWNGRKNFYDQYHTFWSITSADTQGQPETLDFRAWQRTWGPTAEVDPRAEPVIWRHYWENRPFADLVPADFSLDRDAVNNPAVAGASTRNDAGADLDALERLGIAGDLKPSRER